MKTLIITVGILIIGSLFLMYLELNKLKTRNNEYDIKIKNNIYTLDSLKIIKYD